MSNIGWLGDTSNINNGMLRKRANRAMKSAPVSIRMV